MKFNTSAEIVDAATRAALSLIRSTSDTALPEAAAVTVAAALDAAVREVARKKLLQQQRCDL